MPKTVKLIWPGASTKFQPSGRLPFFNESIILSYRKDDVVVIFGQQQFYGYLKKFSASFPIMYNKVRINVGLLRL